MSWLVMAFIVTALAVAGGGVILTYNDWLKRRRWHEQSHATSHAHRCRFCQLRLQAEVARQ